MSDHLDPATVQRREPLYSTTDELTTFPAPPAGRHSSPLEELADLPPDGLPVPIAIETRKMIVVEHGSAALQGTADGTGLLDLDFGRVPANQWWIIDQLVVRGTAAGSFLAFDAGQVGTLNDSDLLGAGQLVSPGFAGQLNLSGVYVKPGRQLFVRTIGAGNGATITARILYRIASLEFGRQEQRP